MASGIAIDGAVESTFAQLSRRQYSTMFLKINDTMSEVNVERTLPGSDEDLEAQWKSFVKTIPESDCRYIVTDFRWKETPTVTKSKIIMILWSPDDASVRSKMIYASSQEAVLAKVTAARSIQASEHGELAYSVIKDAVVH